MTNTRCMTVLDQKTTSRALSTLKRHSQTHSGRGSNTTPGSPTLIRLLAESALHRAIFDACSVPIALIDLRSADYPIALVNPAFEACLGYESSDVHERPLADLLLGGGAEAARRLLTVPASRVLLSAARRDGSSLNCEVTAGLVRGGDGELSYAVLAFSTRSEQGERTAQTAIDVLTLASA
jgi:PAS domain S-box-containing protein